MKRYFIVLVMFLGLGSFISFAKDGPDADPLQLYLKAEKSGKHEPALYRFVKECNMNQAISKPHFAQSSGSSWTLVKNFLHAQEDQEADWYGTAEVWTDKDRAIVERWDVSFETTGEIDEKRDLFYIEGHQIQKVERVEWKYRFGDDDSKALVGSRWVGYEQRWKRMTSTSYSAVYSRYVAIREKTVMKPKDPNLIPEVSESSPRQFTREDLKLPQELFSR